MKPFIIYLAISFSALGIIGNALQGVATDLEARTAERVELINSIRR